MFQQFKRNANDRKPDAAKNAAVAVQAPPVPMMEAPEFSRGTVESTDQENILRTDRNVYLHQQVLELVNLEVLEKMDRNSIGYELTPILRELLARERIVLNSQEYELLLEELLD